MQHPPKKLSTYPYPSALKRFFTVAQYSVSLWNKWRQTLCTMTINRALGGLVRPEGELNTSMFDITSAARRLWMKKLSCGIAWYRMWSPMYSQSRLVLINSIALHNWCPSPQRAQTGAKLLPQCRRGRVMSCILFWACPMSKWWFDLTSLRDGKYGETQAHKQEFKLRSNKPTADQQCTYSLHSTL